MTWFVVYMANVAEKHLEKIKALLAHMHLLISRRFSTMGETQSELR